MVFLDLGCQAGPHPVPGTPFGLRPIRCQAPGGSTPRETLVPGTLQGPLRDWIPKNEGSRAQIARQNRRPERQTLKDVHF